MLKKMILSVLFSVMIHTCCTAYTQPDFKVLLEKGTLGDSYSQAVLGEMYYRGELVDADLGQSLYWFHKAAEQEEALALFYLGFMGISGMNPGEQYRDSQSLLSKSIPGLESGAEKGDPRSQLALVSLYRYGLGVERDTEKSNYYLDQAVDQCFPRAFYAQGITYFNGIGVEVNYHNAIEYFKKAEELGDNQAGYNLANMYYNGQGFTKDVQKSKKLFAQFQGYNTLNSSKVEEGDLIIPKLYPPKYSLTIEEGSCGECCIWSLANSKVLNKVSQIEINEHGGAPGRGLRSPELIPALEKLGISFKELSKKFDALDSKAAAKQYRKFLYEDVLGAIKKGHPVIIGVKVYPTRFPQWAYDHFVLVVGHNQQTRQLIYNDFTNRRRIDAETLVNQRGNGYSFINDYNIVFALEITHY